MKRLLQCQHINLKKIFAVQRLAVCVPFTFLSVYTQDLHESLSMRMLFTQSQIYAMDLHNVLTYTRWSCASLLSYRTFDHMRAAAFVEF